MSKLKDKLSANMRAVKADQQPPAAQTTTEVAPERHSKPPADPVTKPKSAQVARPISSDGVPASGNALFPSRVWPD